MVQRDRIGACVIAWLVSGGLSLAGQDPDPRPPVAAPAEAVPAQHDKEDFAGVWDYNADESIDIRTGRPEQRPRSATQRGSTGTPASRGTSGGSRGGSGTGDPAGGGGGFGGGDGGGRGGNIPMTGPTPAMMREARDMARDLLEVAERLTIKVGEKDVAITDDLDRQRTYVTDNRKERHQIAASRFDVRTEWRDSQLIQQIEGAFDFKMSQTFFLSADGRRLFLMVRVGEPRRNVPQAGFNRVYDRVE
jgi:hypothetical protein